jgi:hypothetical protein
MKRLALVAIVVLAGVAAGCDWPVTSTVDRYAFARSSGRQTVVYVVAPDTSGGLEAEIARTIAAMDARADLRVIRTATDPGHAYNRIVVKRRPMNGGSNLEVWPLDDPHRSADIAAGIVRLRWVYFDNSGPWDPTTARWLVWHEVAGHALCSLDHPTAGFGPGTDTGTLTLWDQLLCQSQLAAVRSGAPAGI